MIKNYTKTKSSAQVTFNIPSEVKAESAYLVGDFNGWDTKSLPMKRNRDGSFSITISLKPGNDYDYKYLVNGQRWENDPAADGMHKNPFGTENSVVKV
jgi:1,4-alpha-glucan branching enzyme